MYNALEKLRSGEALTAKEKVIHEQGLVSVLREIHDAIDAAVFEAYGWPTTLTDEEILERLVALNHQRAEEEKRGLVRWLRPEFQNPGGGGMAVQDDLPGANAGPVLSAGDAVGGPEAKRPWPKEIPAQVAVVRDLLAAAGTLDPARARAAFSGARAGPARCRPRQPRRPGPRRGERRRRRTALVGGAVRAAESARDVSSP